MLVLRVLMIVIDVVYRILLMYYLILLDYPYNHCIILGILVNNVVITIPPQ